MYAVVTPSGFCYHSIGIYRARKGFGAKMKIDFLQIGFPRCGTTFLSSSVYPQNPHLECIDPDDEFYKLLVYKFIMADGFEYERQSFEKEFTRLCETAFTNKQAKVRGIRLFAFSFWPERASK